MTDSQHACATGIPNIAVRLRNETRKAHCDIESIMSGLLFAEPFDVIAYYQVLSKHYAYYRNIEKMFTQFGSTVSLAAERSKLNWLSADIEYLQAFVPEEQQSGGDIRRVKITMPQNEAQALGFLYVSEGATLGGAHILERLRHCSYFRDNQGLRFFQSYGRQTPAMWKRFQTDLNEYVIANPGCEDNIIQGANASFSNMTALMKGVRGD